MTQVRRKPHIFSLLRGLKHANRNRLNKSQLDLFIINFMHLEAEPDNENKILQLLFSCICLPTFKQSQRVSKNTQI